jgi:hypothetical protein
MASDTGDNQTSTRSASRESEAEDKDQKTDPQVDDHLKEASNNADSEEDGEAHEDEIETTKATESLAQNTTNMPVHLEEDSNAPPLPKEDVPPLPLEAPPGTEEDDGWAPMWDDASQAFYFVNRFTGASQWTNPRVPEASAQIAGPPGVSLPPKPTICS